MINLIKWKEHLQYIKNKISKSIRITYKITPYLDKATLKNLYLTFVYPYLLYCLEVCGNACDTHLQPIIKIQKRCIRTITFSCYFEQTEPLFKELEILSFKRLVIQRILLMMLKYSLGIVPKPIICYLLETEKFIITILDILVCYIL